MSVRKKPERAVPVLLARLKKAKEQVVEVLADDDAGTHKMSCMLEEIESTLNQMSKSVSRTKRWEKQVMEQFCKLEQLLHDDIFTLKGPELLSQARQQLDMADLKTLISTVDLTMSPQNNQAAEVASHELQDEIIEFEMSSLPVPIPGEKCLVRLLEFPENSPIKKRPLIYWWMGEGLVRDEEAGEQVFRQLLEEGFIRPTATNSLTLCPWVRRALTAQEDGRQRIFLPRGEDAMDVENVRTVFNMSEQYVGITGEWLRRLQNVEVLQLGRWQDSATHHIEVEKYEQLLSGLGSQKKLKYMSLRGISGIETLPPTIRKLVGLQILDVRACHNLEKLPHTISDLRNLTHLDVSECYLLESMPKGIQHLSKLQVLKGFVVDSAWRGSCKIADLAGLAYLRKLSVRVRSQGGDQLGSLGNLSDLRILTISWMEVVVSVEVTVELPIGLTKLDLRSVPFEELPEWLHPRKLPKLEKLRIKGGRLNRLNTHVYRNLKFARLHYLTDLIINQKELVAMFPDYLYLEQITSHEDRPNILILSRSSISNANQSRYHQIQDDVAVTPGE